MPGVDTGAIFLQEPAGVSDFSDRESTDRGWRRIGDGLLRLGLGLLLVGITALAGTAAQYHWSLEDVRWLHGVTSRIDASGDAIERARRQPLPATIALPEPLSTDVPGLAEPIVPGRRPDARTAGAAWPSAGETAAGVAVH